MTINAKIDLTFLTNYLFQISDIDSCCMPIFKGFCYDILITIIALDCETVLMNICSGF